MKSLFITSIVLMVTALVLTPVLLNAYTDQTTAARPPVSQPLVREGTLAVGLAVALKMGTPAGEAEAESMLSAAGVSPVNGWIADYPVTPDIIGELQTSVSMAAESGRIPVGKDEALKSLQGVMSGYSLTVRPDISGRGGGAASGLDYPDATVVNNYYYDEGPPVVTYYAPPPDYAYLYSWVPYPFWWWGGFWFPGFFVLADFDGHHHDGHHDGHGHDGEHFSNHFRDARTGQMSRVDPANRAHGGTFANARSASWSSASARNGAQGIFNSSRGVGMTGGNSRPVSASGNGRVSGLSSRSSASVSSSGARSTMSGAPAGRTYSGSRYTSGRTFAPSSVGSRSFSSPYSGGRTFSAPSSGRAYSSFGGGRSVSSFGGGMHAFAGSRGSFGGGGRR